MTNKENMIHHWIGIGKDICMQQIFFPKNPKHAIKMEDSKMSKNSFSRIKRKIIIFQSRDLHHCS